MWYRDPRHPELGDMFLPDSEAAAGALPPGMDIVPPPTGEWTFLGVTEGGSSFRHGPVEVAPSVAVDHTRAIGPDAPKDELNRRLAESRCYWCGRPINSDDPYEMFERESCERAWRTGEHADLNQGGIHVNPNTPSYPDFGFQPTDPGDTFPRWLGTPRHDLGLNHFPAEPPPAWEEVGATADDTGPITAAAQQAAAEVADTGGRVTERAFSGWRRLADRIRYGIRDVPPLPARYDYTVQAVTDGRRYGRGHSSIPATYSVRHSDIQARGTVIGPFDTLSPGVAQRSVGDFAIGYPHLTTGQDVALRQLAHGPFGDTTGWPIREVRRLQRYGFSLALPPGADYEATAAFMDVDRNPLPPVRRCPRCQQTEMPTCHEADYPEVIREFGYAMQIDLRRATHVVCGGCLMPYPGPMMVPFWRDTAGMMPAAAAELAVAWPGGLHSVRVSRTMLEVPDRERTRGLMWGDLYEQALISASGGRCVAPQCGAPTWHWVSLAASMRVWGWTVTPVDGEPLLLGLCPHHMVDLHYQVMGQHSLGSRITIGVHVEGNRDHVLVR